MFNRNKTSEMIVKPRVSPRIKLTLAIVAAAVFLATLGAIYNYGLNTAGFKRFVASKKQEQLQNQIEQLKQANRELTAALARAERTLQMDQAAYQELDHSLKESSREIVKLREELNFYRNIISPPNKKSGVRIQSLNIDKTEDKNTYRYKLVLIQALKHDRTVRGRARFEIVGMQAGKSTVLKFPAANQKPIDVKFRYFQDVEGEIRLPQNFEPRQIKASVTTTGRGSQTVEQVYNWPRV